MSASRMRRAAVLTAATAVIFVAAIFLRHTSFWTSHSDPVEMAYVALAMKMGVHPALDGYHLGGIQIQHKEVPRVGEPGGRPVPIVFPVESSLAQDKSFAAWPNDPNPFFYKPPLFPSLLAFSHHRTLGPKFAFYPVIAPGLESGRSLDKSQAVLGVQAWAMTVPALSGLIVVALTLVLGWRMFGGAVGLIAALIVATHPVSVLISSRIWPEATLTACLLAAVVLFHFFTSIRSWAGCLLAGLMYGLAVLTDASALFVLPAFWLWTVGLPDYKETVGGRWARVRALINPYFGVFLLGAVWIGKAWFDHTAHAFGDFALRRAVWTASAGLLPGMSFVNQTVQLFLQYPLLIAAIFSITAFWKKNTSPDQNSLVRVVWFFVVSLIGARWLFSPRSVWDERALALAVPFIAILAANGVCHALNMIRSAILKNPDELPMNSR